jgi:hypothetical protein
MNKTRLTLKAFAFLAFTLACASAAHAQATRTWVSGVGDDVNPCSRTAPCKTFAGAISKTAVNGEIDCIDPGGFGTVTITKSITIDGDGTFASILAAGTNGVNVNDSASATPNTAVVRLRNISINGAGTGLDGIRFIAGKILYVENVQIFGFRGNNATTSDGIDVALTVAASQLLFVKDCNIEENSGDGLRLGNTAVGGAINAFVDNTRLERNSGVGIRAAQVTALEVRNSSLSFNVGSNLRIENASSFANLENSFFDGSPASGIIAAAGNVRLRGNHITNNGTAGVNCTGGGTISSFGDNAIKGNATDIVICTDPLPPLGKK